MRSPAPFGALVVTSIAAPNAVLQSLAEGAARVGVPFIVIGDSKSPEDFQLEGCDFWSLARQRETPFAFAEICPERCYSRKNIGYLLAIQSGADSIVETDDDNFPREAFWAPRNRSVSGHALPVRGWVNAYAWFADTFIYPRGFPLESARAGSDTHVPRGAWLEAQAPVQQGLADENPDVDAVYRMLYPLPFTFRQDPPLLLGAGQWCPYNSQNTTTFREAFPLLYLPVRCSFRMTDIWRSFVAQRILWANGMHVAFLAASVWQERNAHDLLRDFEDEIPGYANNAKIAKALAEVEIPTGFEHIPDAMRICYRRLVQGGWVGSDEPEFLDAWLQDLRIAARD